ncbi:MAG: hypothetical protein COZ75_04625 [Flavobacteriaceae bacterium CG_4_8_14_3_um_filter_34_10]|nr:DUF4168 domain-containing protein [Flavobacteriia bacterium]OIP52035.1 MAG: hypothetical protein AUK33_02370 [Flavobacteriaceae bacterium CG2_30_34_30]PIV49150.1 MAG: hypothetical protein COS19_10120 [Flavobacteriaceae bacterium CG02_land_8_20_14_3_00_34_13]PIX09849.1 MAG: hypothetical protein COZ75_04625 [Flavobacteriaceae bacterium CG_4_8_14_3_um_filter_34_10]PJC06809.1 MAG: hypothetical protein CO068_09195 [Flavobacteriaceae bacterium CG_4_9_14_0_8_um_filter_34_30]
MKNINKTVKSIFVLFLFATLSSYAQEKVSDTELNQFVASIKAVQEINQSAQKDMIALVEQSGFELVRFNELFEYSQNPSLPATNATEEETKKFDGVIARMEVMQPVFQKQMEDAVTKLGITIDRFEEIGNILEGDIELQERFQALMIE